ncbi:hypothetical protein [Pseudomonas syringae]|uniref:hypothetical protein n=1 Tax=Pseudomonas syringae TaxID=317 RepID=UPI00200A1C14|nr:hypothetical protein [Pseudomonas syringae]MCK9709843.1 hypothetical protein [Pseudomonas syringae pv. syringae]
MTFDEKARLVRLNADQDAIKYLLDDHPWGDSIAAREPGSITASSLGLERLSTDPVKRKNKLLVQFESYENSLLRSIAKHDLLKRNGLSEICDSDLMVCYSGNPIAACMHTMRLHEAHISYDRSVLEILDSELAKLDSSVPYGFVQIDAVLSEFDAFQAIKWADAAKARLEQARKQARLNARTKQRTSNDSDSQV